MLGCNRTGPNDHADEFHRLRTQLYTYRRIFQGSEGFYKVSTFLEKRRFEHTIDDWVDRGEYFLRHDSRYTCSHKVLRHNQD